MICIGEAYTDRRNESNDDSKEKLFDSYSLNEK